MVTTVFEKVVARTRTVGVISLVDRHAWVSRSDPPGAFLPWTWTPRPDHSAPAAVPFNMSPLPNCAIFFSESVASLALFLTYVHKHSMIFTVIKL